MVKGSKYGMLIIAAILVVAAVIYFQKRTPPMAEPGAQPRPDIERAPTAPRPPDRAAEPVPTPPPPPPPAPEPEPVERSVDEESGDPVVGFRADHVLAVVNGVAVTGRDLILFGAAATPVQALPQNEFDFLFNRALERELIFQEARRENLALTDQQTRQLDLVRQTVMDRQAGDPNAVFLTARGTLDEQAAFEMREAEAMLLQNSLLEKQGVRPPHVSADRVRAHYEANIELYGDLPEDEAERAAVWRKLDYQIRMDLAPVIQAEYRDKRDAFIEQLKSQADIRTYTDALSGP